MAQQVDYAALAAQARRGAAAPAPVDYAALAEQARQSERRTTPPPAAAMRGMLSPSTPEGGNALPTPDELLRQWATGGPGRMATGVREIVTGSPLRGSADVLTGLGTTLAPVALPALGYAAVTAPVLTGIGLASSYVVGQAGRAGGARVAESLGATPEQQEAAGTIGEFLTGSAAGVGGPTLMSRLRTRNPVSIERRAVQSVMDRGLPVDAGTVTGNPVVRGAQWLADRTLGGSLVATRANARTRQAYARDWDQLAARTGVAATDKFAAGSRAQEAQDAVRESIGRGYATAADRVQARIGGTPQSARQTGAQATGALSAVVRDLRQQAERAYGDAFTQMRAARVPVTVGTTPGQSPRPSGLLDAAGRPVLTGGTGPQPVVEAIETPVDITDLKTAPFVQDLWNDLNELPIAMKSASQAYASLQKLLTGPDVVSARAAERARSGLLDLAREAASPDVRNVNQGTAASLAQVLRQRIDQAVEQYAGPDALAALNAGRATHAQKMQVADVLQQFSDEGVQAFNKMTWTDDRGVGLLEDVATVAPQVMPQLANTWFSQVVGKRTADGVLDLSKWRAMQADYARLGADTRALFFRNPGVRRQVDAFFAQLPTGAQASGPRLATEPVAVATQLLGRNDSHAAQLQAIARIAPDVPAQLMRASMDDVAQEFSKGRKLTTEDLLKFRTWFNQFGPRTLQIVAPDPAFRRDLDYTTRVLSRLAENPGLGSAFVNALQPQLGLSLVDIVGTQSAGAAVAALLRSPRLTRALAKGLSMPNTPEAARYAGTVLQLLQAERDAEQETR
jgi:hypothetical protein